jgi:hypothetical protein
MTDSPKPQNRVYFPTPPNLGSMTREEVDAWAAEIFPLLQVSLGLKPVPDFPPEADESTPSTEE